MKCLHCWSSVPIVFDDKQILVSFSSSDILTRFQSPYWRRRSKLNLEINSSTWSGSTIIDRRSPSDSHLGDGRSLAALTPGILIPGTASSYYLILDRMIAKQRNSTQILESLAREHWELDNNHENTIMPSPVKFERLLLTFLKVLKARLALVGSSSPWGKRSEYHWIKSPSSSSSPDVDIPSTWAGYALINGSYDWLNFIQP